MLSPGQQRRAARQQAARRRILDAAWALSDQHGLVGWSLRDLGAAVGMRAPSLYGYFDSKHAVYDAMFADGQRQLLASASRVLAVLSGDPRADAHDLARFFLGFAVENPARFTLMFLRTIPGFEPSPASYALARESLDYARVTLARAGLETQRDLDLWTAVLSGLASQQISNDPGGRRWLDLVDTAVDRLLLR